MFATSTPNIIAGIRIIPSIQEAASERRFAPVNWCDDCDTVLATVNKSRIIVVGVVVSRYSEGYGAVVLA